MEFITFPARLRAPYNDICVAGEGRICEFLDAVDFIGDFVPLAPLNETAYVDWITRDRVAGTFFGRVYLSSPRLMRLVGIDALLAAKARRLFASNADLPGRLLALDGPGKKNTDHQNAGAEVRIVYLERDFAVISSAVPAENGEEALLFCEVDFFTLSGALLTVTDSAALRPGQTLLYCRLSAENSENFVALSAYTARLAKLKSDQIAPFEL